MAKKNKSKKNHPLSGLGEATIRQAATASSADMRAKKAAQRATAKSIGKDLPQDYPYLEGSSREETVDYRKVQVKVMRLYDGFALEQVSHFSWDGELSYVLMMVRVFPKNTDLISFIRGYTEQSDAHKNTCLVSLSGLVSEVDKAESELADYDDAPSSITAFVAFLQEQVAEIREIYQRMVTLGRINYDLLDQHFKVGSRVAFGGTNNDELECGVVTEVAYGYTMMGPRFEITMARYASDGKHFGKVEETKTISGYRGDVRFEELPVRIASTEELERLAQRGRVWQNYVHKPQYLNYDGRISYRVGWSEISQNAIGRCMIDLATHNQVVTTERWARQEIELDRTLTAVPEDYLVTTPGYVHGFSLPKKRWGKFSFSGLSPIAFRDDAYDLLVLDEDVKSEVRALVEQSEDMFSDIITGKGGGAIFLLHGTPGLGKTLTAESIAEILHRPLYSISVGELGVTPGEVEETLQSVLEMVTAWNAVLLLDEADIFLEARSKDDIVRNAMVGVFLRLLEYHNGVLFLTTNRVGNFDTAVLSRISVILKYGDFTTDTRKSVWSNILGAAGLSDIEIDLDYMATKYPVNGRQIKNAIRISLSLAQSRNQPVTQELIEGRLARMLSVIQELNGSPGTLEPAVVPKQKPLLL